jgi:hypothetical protein
VLELITIQGNYAADEHKQGSTDTRVEESARKQEDATRVPSWNEKETSETDAVGVDRTYGRARREGLYEFSFR